MAKHLHPLKIVYLYRDKKDHLASQLRVTFNNHSCYWLPHNHPVYISEKYKASAYDRTLPSFSGAKDKVDAINMYWEHYQTKAKELKEQYPDMMFFLQTEEINNHRKQVQLFDFLEIPEQDRVYQSKVRK